MSLLVSKVPRALEAKTKVFGFELGDLLLILTYLSLTNLIFGQTPVKFPVVWLGTLALAGGLYLFKKGKPDQYLQHSVQYLIAPGSYAAGAPDTDYRPYLVTENSSEDTYHERSRA